MDAFVPQNDEWFLHGKIEKEGDCNDYQPIKAVSPCSNAVEGGREVLVHNLHNQHVGQKHCVRKHTQMGNHLSYSGGIRLDADHKREPQRDGYGWDGQREHICVSGADVRRYEKRERYQHDAGNYAFDGMTVPELWCIGLEPGGQHPDVNAVATRSHGFANPYIPPENIGGVTGDGSAVSKRQQYEKEADKRGGLARTYPHGDNGQQHGEEDIEPPLHRKRPRFPVEIIERGEKILGECEKLPKRERVRVTVDDAVADEDKVRQQDCIVVGKDAKSGPGVETEGLVDIYPLVLLGV